MRLWFAGAGAFLIAAAGACGSSSSTHATASGIDAGDDRGDDAAGSIPPVDAAGDDAPSILLDTGASEPEAGVDAGGIVAGRPYTLHVPSGYDATKPTPLVVMFHGYSATGALQEAYMQLAVTSDAHTFLYAYADGTVDKTGERFWNATDACCDLYGIPVDDVQYFDAIVADIESRYNVDTKRIYEVGHSNGGFMGHRLACDRASTLAAVVSLAGAQWLDPGKCFPSEPVSILEMHGTADAVIDYNGGSTTEGTYPSAQQTVTTWAGKDGCTGALAPTGEMLDIDPTLPGSETIVARYGGCPAGIDVELMTIQGGSHIPTINHPAWGELVWGFLSSHPKK
jgi:polyhydroxybutyrate depolymerase